METLDYQPTLKKPERPFGLQNFLAIGAGPCTVSPRVLNALVTPVLQPFNADLVQLFDEVQAMLKYLFQTKNDLTFVQQSAAHGANETMVSNLTERGDTVIVCISGHWGRRLATICRCNGLEVVTLESDPGEVFTVKEIEEAVVKHKPTAVFLVHGETMSGVLQPLEGIADVCHRNGCLLGVDAVVSIAAVPLFVDRWKLDAVVGGSQKAVGCIPGISLLTFSPLAKERIWSRKEPPSYYFNVKSMAAAWKCFGEKRGFHCTYSSNLLAALREAFSSICEEGLLNSWRRHRECAELLYEGLEKIGLELCVKTIENRLHVVTPFVLPADVPWLAVFEHLLESCQLEVSPGVGQNVVRVGFLGFNARKEVVEYFLEKLVKSIDYVRRNSVKESEDNVYKQFGF